MRHRCRSLFRLRLRLRAVCRRRLGCGRRAGSSTGLALGSFPGPGVPPPPEPRARGEPPPPAGAPTFSPEDVGAWRRHLEAEGFVRLRGVLSLQEVESGVSLFWDWLEGLGGGARRADPATWTAENFPGKLKYGFFCTRGGGQSEAAWALRGSRTLHRVFSHIWGTEDLIASLDTFIGWRPWWPGAGGDESWRPGTEGMHCDQNPHNRRGLAAVQGMLVLRPATRELGGLAVAPRTHTDGVQDHLASLFDARRGDWLPLEMEHPEDPLVRCGELVEADPGDLILWDSRVLHGAHVGPGPSGGQAPPPALARLVFTVCFVPRGWAPQSVLEARRGAVEKGLTLTHWPHAYDPHTFQDTDGSALASLEQWRESYRPPAMDAWRRQILG